MTPKKAAGHHMTSSHGPESGPALLIIDDDRSFLETVAELLRHAGYAPRTAFGGEEGLETLAREEEKIAVVLLDMRMPGMDGLEVLGKIVRSHPLVPVIMLTGENAIDLVVQAMKGGAFNYVYKGSSAADLLAAVEGALERSPRAPLPSEDGGGEAYGIIGRSPSLRSMLNDARLCAQSSISVLVTGETGVGKDLLARAIHTMSPRHNRPFVTLDVPNIPSTMFESELFGHTKGAFTGAADAKQGLAQAADTGTLFLDEIGEFPVEFQAKFLRVLDSGQVRRLGSVNAESVDVRIISATNRDLLEAVRSRTFREDLLYRLRGFEIHIPPLRQRREDIAPLARHFLAEFCTRNGMPPRHLSEAAIEILERWTWPGNARELRRTVEGAAVVTQGDRIEHSEIARILERSAPAGSTPQTSVVHDYNDVQALARQTKKDELIKILDRNAWNITRAAAELDIDRSTLSKQMKNLGISKPRVRL